jgi:hypothetical protein
MSKAPENPSGHTHPPRFTVGDQIMANDKAPSQYRGRRGLITEVSPGGWECRVEFEDGAMPASVYLSSRWLER